MKNNRSKIAVTIFSMLLCFTVFAQRQGGRNGGQGQQRGGKPDAAKILSMLDTNNDDKIDIREASKDRRGRISENFNRIDTNDDKFIDLEELKASLSGKRPEKKINKISPEKLMEKVDDNGDGRLNELEIAAKDEKHLIKNFKLIDVNNDNEINLEELKAFYSKKDKKRRREKH